MDANSKEFKDLVDRLAAVEKLAQATADQVDGLAAGKPAPLKALPATHLLHPSKAGLPEHEELKRKLMSVKPNEKGYADAQDQLRAAGIVG